MMVLLCACSLPFGAGAGKSDHGEETQEETLEEEPLSASSVEDDGRYHIGILTYRSHGAAEETVRGFKKELVSMLGNDHVVFEETSADGDPEKCAEIATDYANRGMHLIFACGTEAVQNAGAAVGDTPIIGACVTDFLLSEVVSSLEAPGKNISGVSCLGPIENQVEMMLQVTSWPAGIGIISSGIEVGSRFQESVAGQFLTEKDIPWLSYHAANEDGLRKAMEQAAQECTCLYLPTDSFVASHMDIVRDVVLDTKIPVVTGDYQMCAGGGLCSCSIDYYQHGKTAAEMAYAVLEKGEEISRMAVREEENWEQYYNPEIAESLEWYPYNNNMFPLTLAQDAEETGMTDETAVEEGAMEETQDSGEENE